MAAGLFTGFNLSEEGLNATDALQKLYAPQVQQDLLLFAFSNRLESIIYSASAASSNQIYGLINDPITDAQGNIILRTKILTQGEPGGEESSLQSVYTFSDNNLVWFDRVPSGLESSVRVSVNGSIVNTSVLGTGDNYKILDSNGDEIPLPAQIDVRVRGEDSGSDNGRVKITVASDGSVDRLASVAVVTPGTGYIDQETLEIIPGCRENDVPAEDGCLLYTEEATRSGGTYSQSGNTVTVTLNDHGLSDDDQVTLDFISGESTNLTSTVTVTNSNTFTVQSSQSKNTSGDVKVTIPNCSLVQDPYVSGKPSVKALLKNERYTYRVRFSGNDGFFLYDDKVSQYLHLGASYDSLQVIPAQADPSMVMRRRDEISSRNLSQLYNLDGASSFFSYSDNYATGSSIGNTIRGLSDAVEELKDGFKYFVQNTRLPSGSLNNLGTSYNIIEGRNINTNHRIVFRDPDGVLDQPVFEDSSATYSQSGTVITVTSTGHGLSTGDKVNLIFSTGTAIDGRYEIATASTNEFTVTSGQSATTSGDVLVRQGVNFFELGSLTGVGETTYFDQNIPGIWLWSGDKYRRIFSSDDKPFMSRNEKEYLSPAIYDISGSLVAANEYRYSISTAYYKPGEPATAASIKGFDTTLSVLIQNITPSTDPDNGGFVYHRTLTTETVKTTADYTVKSWPLFSYLDGSAIKDAKFLAI